MKACWDEGEVEVADERESRIMEQKRERIVILGELILSENV